MSLIIAPGGSLEVTLSAGQKVCVATRGKASLASKAPASEGKVLASANPEPAILVDGAEYVSAAYANGGVVLVQNMGPFLCYVEQGTDPLSKAFRRETEIRGAAVAHDSSGNITLAAMLSTSITSAANTVQADLLTGAALDASTSWRIGEGVTWGVVKVGANAYTVTASAGHTLQGSGVVATTTSAAFRTVKTAANTFVTTRVA